MRLTYIGKIEGRPKLNEENTEYQWFTKEELYKVENLDFYFAELLKQNLI